MSKEYDNLDFTETVVDFTILCQKYGVRAVLHGIRQSDARLYDEIKVQINREPQQIAALLVKRL